MPTGCVAKTCYPRLGTSLAVLALLAASTAQAAAQSPEPATRQAAIETAQAEKVPMLHPYVPEWGERLMDKTQSLLNGPDDGWHPFFDSAYREGGFPFGAGYRKYLSSYNAIDVRGSYTARGYKRVEAEFIAPGLFEGRGQLSVLGGWREATQVGFFGIGTATSADARTNYAFRQPYASALLSVAPTRNYLTLQGGAEWTRWSQRPGEGTAPSVDTRFTAATLPGLGAEPTYLHSQGTVGFDWRTSPGYSRRGGFYGVTFHDFTDRDNAFGFQQFDYEAIQHLPIFREAWTLSLHGKASTTSRKDGEDIPFFMLPALGGGTDLRGFSSWRFRDRDSLLLQGEWRIMVNRFLDTALFYDAGTVASRLGDIDLHRLKSDYGFGARIHGPFQTFLRIDVARSNEKTALVLSSSAIF
jgi:hypothetical protein